MSAPSFISPAAVQRFVGLAASRAWRDWSHTGIGSEEVLLASIMLTLKRWCGHARPSGQRIQMDVHNLHRKAKDQKDLHGADLAVTVLPPIAVAAKTAFVQLKVSEHGKAGLRLKQLDDALIHGHVGPNSFVMFVDKRRAEFRIQPTPSVRKQFPLTKKKNATRKTTAYTHKAMSAKWMSLPSAVAPWLMCKCGTPSAPQFVAERHLFRDVPPASRPDFGDPYPMQEPDLSPAPFALPKHLLVFRLRDR